jgi:hypothetical protein
LPSVRRIEEHAFQCCHALTDAVFSKDLERIVDKAFFSCRALRRIIIPLKDNLVVGFDVFTCCDDLVSVGILDEGIHKPISSLHMERWRNEMKAEIDRINQTLPNTYWREKTQEIQQWITRVLNRIAHYKSEHQTLVKEAMVLLTLALWKANLRENEADDAAAAAREGVRVTRGQRKRKRKDRCITSGASIVIKNVLPFLAVEVE